MQPNDQTPTIPDDPSRTPTNERDHTKQHEAVANLSRQQIDQLYDTQYADSESVYSQTHTPAHTIENKEWEQYHSAWQDYYQKYYGHYYSSAYEQAHAQLRQHAATLQGQPQGNVATANQPEARGSGSQALSKREAVTQLRSQLLNTVHTRAKKVRKSRHFVPLLSGLAVLLLFVFIQYNSNIVAYAQAYISPGSIDPQNIIADPNLSVDVDPAPRLIIPKINVDVAVNYDATTAHESQMEAMRTGVAYFGIPGANSKPGQRGNVPIAGHSSNDFTAAGQNEVKFVFARLEQLKKGDIFYLNYEGTRYTYAITTMMVVKPTEVGRLVVGEDKPYATLITCTPLGTAEKRLLVMAEQISPSPSEADTAPTSSSDADLESTEMAGKAPTLIERVFGAR